MNWKKIGFSITIILAIIALVLVGTAIKFSWVDLAVYGIFSLAVLAAFVIIPYVLGTKAMFIYGYKEGFISLLFSGVENGGFDRAIGTMKGHTVHDNGDITENATGTPDVKRSFAWIGLWPTHGAMKFDTEQVKLTNKADGSVDMKLETYSNAIYLPIQSTERLLVPGLELKDLASKIDWDVVMTYKMTNAYTAKIRNRGSIKILKAQVMQGLKEKAGDLEYAEALKLKNATGPAFLMGLVDELNGKECGYGTLSETTGYMLLSLDIIGIELSGGRAGAMADAYASIKTTKIAADNLKVSAEARRVELEELGEGNAKAEGLMVNQVIRRLEAQKALTGEQAMALAVEKSKAQVISVGGGHQAVTPLVNLESKQDK
jgi:hypothetical protein